MATRREELAEAATDYALEHGLIGLSLRPLAERARDQRPDAALPLPRQGRPGRDDPAHLDDPLGGRASAPCRAVADLRSRGARPLARASHRPAQSAASGSTSRPPRSACSGRSRTRPRCARRTPAWMAALADHFARVGLGRRRRARSRTWWTPRSWASSSTSRWTPAPSSDGRSATSRTPSPRGGVRRGAPRSARQRVAVPSAQQPVGEQASRGSVPAGRLGPRPLHRARRDRVPRRPGPAPSGGHDTAGRCPARPDRAAAVRRTPGGRRAATRTGSRTGQASQRGEAAVQTRAPSSISGHRPGGGRRLVGGQQGDRDGLLGGGHGRAAGTPRRSRPEPGPAGRWCRAPPAVGRTRRRARPTRCSRRRRAARGVRRRSPGPCPRAAR